MRPLIVKSSLACIIACICVLAAPVQAQRADSTVPVDVPDNGAVIDLTNLVSDDSDSALSEDSPNTESQSSEGLQVGAAGGDNLTGDMQSISQVDSRDDDTVIDEILAEIDEDRALDDSAIAAISLDNDTVAEDAGSDTDPGVQAAGQIPAGDTQSDQQLDTASAASAAETEAASTVSLSSDAGQAPTTTALGEASTNGDDAANMTASTAAASTTEPATDTANPIQPTARVGRRALSNIGLVSIGLEDANPRRSQLNSLLWQGSEADNIISLMSETPAYGPSTEMNKLLLSALLRQAVPPQGAGQMADEMVDARLSWLAEAGRSEALAQLIRKLPDDAAWQDWQRWLVEYDLLTGNDTDACRKVALAVSETLEPFWHQAQVVCQILSGNTMQAGFTADIVQASGLADPEFMALVNLFLGRTDTVSLDGVELTPLHFIMMDAAHLDMSQAQISQLPVSLLQARTALRYLQRDAQLSVSLQALELGLTDLEATAEILRSLYMPDQSIIQAAARIGVEDTELHGLVRSNLYVQLAGSFARGRDVAEFDTLIAEALRFEATIGGEALLMPLYADLITRRLNAAELPTPTTDIAADFAIWQALASPEAALVPIVSAANPVADAYRTILTLGNNKWSPDMIDAAAAWDWLPLIEAHGAVQPDLSYKMLETKLDILPETISQPIHPLHIFALEQAAGNASMGEVILLAARALASHDLAHIRSSDLAQILAIMREAGLADSAKLIAEEALRARMMDRYFAADS